MRDIFVCYSREDLAIADRLIQHLHEAGWTVFIDRQTHVGHRWHQDIEKELHAAKAVVVLWSISSRESDFVLEEAEYGKRNNLLFPIYIEQVEPPYGFSRIQTADLTGWRNGTDNSGLTKLIEALRQHLNKTASPLPVGENPYKGLAVFKEEDAERFFGRDEEIEKFLRQFLSLTTPLNDQTPVRILPVLGPSGSGKSSLVQAGLLPRIRKVFGDAENGTLTALVFSPRSRPLRQLTIELARLSLEGKNRATCINDYEILLKQTSNGRFCGLLNIVDAIISGAPAEANQHFLLVVDQFEELYTLTDRYADQESIDTESDIFVANLLEAASDREGRIAVIITLRSDFFEQLTHRHKTLASICAEQKSLVGPPTEKGLRQAISVPAARAGSPLSDIVIDQLVAQTLDRDGALPLLQVTLSAIWEGMKQGTQPEETLHKLGGVGGALHEQAENLFMALNETEQNLARHALLAMVQIGENTPDTRKRIQIDELIADSDDPVHLEKVLLHLAGTTINPASHITGLRLITLSGDEDGVRHAEIVHEALLQRWNRLREWIESNRDNLRIRERIRERMRLWQENNNRNDRLLPRGSELEDGRKLLHVAKDIPVADIKPYIQRSLAHQQRNTQVRAGIFVSVIVVLAAFLGWALMSEQEAQQNLLTANFNSAKFYEERALDALAKAQESGNSESYRSAWLYASEAALLDIPVDKQALSSETLGSLLLGNLTRDAFNEYWTSPVLYFYPSLRRIAYSPDGRWLAAGQSSKLYVSKISQLLLWEVASGRLVHRIDAHNENINGLAFSPDSHKLASASSDGSVRLWGTKQGDLLHTLEGGTNQFFDIKFYPDNKHLAVASSQGISIWKPDAEVADITTLKLLEAGMSEKIEIDSSQKWLAAITDNKAHLYARETGDVTHMPRGERGEVKMFDIGFGPQEHMLATAEGPNVHIWDIETRKHLRTFSHDQGIYGLAFSPDKGIMATGGYKGDINLWNPHNGQRLATLSEHIRGINDIAFSPDGSILASVSNNNGLRLWDVRSNAQIQPYEGHSDIISSIAVSPNGSLIATGSYDKSVRLWSTAKGKLVSIFNEHKSAITQIDFSPDSNSLATGSYDGTVILWNIANNQLSHVFTTPDNQVISSISFSLDGKTLAASSGEMVYIWATKSGKLMYKLKSNHGEIQIEYNAENNKLNAASIENETVHFWNVTSKNRIQTFKGHKVPKDSGTYLAFDPTDQFFATGVGSLSRDFVLYIWNIASGNLLHTLPLDTIDLHGSLNIVFSPDGQWIVLSNGYRLYFVETASGKLNRIVDTNCPITALTFTTDGLSLALGCSDKTVRLINAASGAPILAFKEPLTSFVRKISYSSDGKWLALGDQGKTVGIWNISTGRLVRKLPVHGYYEDLAFHPTQPWLAVGSVTQTIGVWNVTSGELKQRFIGNGFASRDNCIVSSDSQLVGIPTPDNKSVRLWDIQEGVLRHTLDQGEIISFAFSPDTQTIAIASDDMTVRLWNVKNGYPGLTIANEKVVSQMGFSPDGRTLLTMDGEKTALWDVGTGHLKHILKQDNMRGISQFSFRPDSKQVAVSTGVSPATMNLWDTASGNKIDSFEAGFITALSFFPDSPLLAIFDNGPLRILNTQTKEWIKPEKALSAMALNISNKLSGRFALPNFNKGILLFDEKGNATSSGSVGALSTGNQMLASIDYNNDSLQISDLNTDQVIQEIKTQNATLKCLEFTPDGEQLIAQYLGYSLHLWDIETGQLLNDTIEAGGHSNSARPEDIVFSPDGRLLASRGLENKSIQLWSIQEGVIKHQLIGHKDNVTSLAFSPNNQLLASSGNESIKIWNVKNGKLVGTLLTESKDPVRRLTFNSEGTILASSNEFQESEVRLWDVHTLSLRLVIKDNSSPVFSPNNDLLATNTEKKGVNLWDTGNGKLKYNFPDVHIMKDKTEGVFSSDGRIIATKYGNSILALWDVKTGHKLHELQGSNPFSFAPDGRTFTAGIFENGQLDSGVFVWPLDMRLLDLFTAKDKQQRAILHHMKQGVELLWQRKVDGSNIIESPRQPRLYTHNDYFFEHEDRIRPLLDPPSLGQSKFDQVYEWAAEQARLK